MTEARTDEPLTLDEISNLRWTRSEHLEILGIDKSAGAVRALATRLLEEIARANKAEQRADKAELDARNMQRERDAAHIEVAARTAERDEARAIVEAACAELNAFAAARIPDEIPDRAVTAVTSVTAPFVARMCAILQGGAQ